MNDSARRRIADETATKAMTIAATLHAQDRHGQTVIDRMRDAQVGHLRSPSIEPGSSSKPEDLSDELRGKTNYSDPTGTAGVQVAQQGDQAARRLEEVEKRLARMARDAAVVEAIFAEYATRTPTVIDRQETTPTDGCESCARIDSPGSVGLPKAQRSAWWNPVFRNVNLADGTKRALCRWCSDWQRTHDGELPERVTLETYRDQGRVRSA